MTDDQMDRYAASLANAAVVSTGDPASAACVLLQAAGAVMMANASRDDAIAAFEALASCTADTFRRITLPHGIVQ